MLIRHATKSDLSEIVKMATEMAELHHQLDAYYKPASQYQNLEDDLEKELGDKDGLMLVAEDGGKIVGYFRGSVEKAPDYASVKKIGVVYDLFVKPEHRKAGTGGKLMDAAMDWFNTKKVKNIELSVDARNAGAVNFWKKSGFLEYKLRLRKDL